MNSRHLAHFAWSVAIEVYNLRDDLPHFDLLMAITRRTAMMLSTYSCHSKSGGLSRINVGMEQASVRLVAIKLTPGISFGQFWAVLGIFSFLGCNRNGFFFWNWGVNLLTSLILLHDYVVSVLEPRVVSGYYRIGVRLPFVAKNRIDSRFCNLTLEVCSRDSSFTLGCKRGAL